MTPAAAAAETIRRQQLSQQNILRAAFLCSINSVKPKAIFTAIRTNNKCIMAIDKNCLFISGGEIRASTTTTKQESTVEYELSGRQCHLVGFGKAVLGMAVQIEKVLGDRLQSGIISVPFGTGEKFKNDPDMQLCSGSPIKVYEGAKNNLPDKEAAETSTKILQLVRKLDENDLLFVAISGGGSALFPLPIPPVTLDEKQWLIKQLATREATINEINAVRRELSQTKGGKLAVAAAKAHAIISLIISDVSGDPLDIIASGPTVPLQSDLTASLVLEKYKLFDVPPSIRQVLSTAVDNNISADTFANAHAYIIGNNQLAADTAVAEMRTNGYHTICLTTKCEGNVQVLSECYVKIASIITNVLNGSGQIEDLDEIFVGQMDEYFHFSSGAREELCKALESNVLPICLVSGGETTVRIQGPGLGGRNQELSLRVSKLLAMDNALMNVTFLSGGTDGIDGPTDAAGAIGCTAVISDWNLSKSDGDETTVDDVLLKNDSYNFYKMVANGRYHLMTGHTGTNVMDLHLMIIPK